jgi:hypothetical protein
MTIIKGIKISLLTLVCPACGTVFTATLIRNRGDGLIAETLKCDECRSALVVTRDEVTGNTRIDILDPN